MMRFIGKTAIFALIALLSVSFVYASGGQEVKSGDSGKDTSTATTKSEGGSIPGLVAGEKALFITDFEDPAMYTRTYVGPVSKIEFEFSKEKVHDGKQSIKMTTSATESTAYFSGIEIKVPPAASNWSQMRFVKMWIFGADSKVEIKPVIEDSQKEQFRATFVDDFSGWKLVSVPIGAFVSRTDYQHPDAKINEKIDYPVKTLHFFTSNANDLVLYYDLIYATDDGRKKVAGEEEEFVPQIKPAYTLKQLAEEYSFSIGAAATVSEIRVPLLASTLARDYGSLTAGNEMKFYVIKKDKATYNFGPADELMKYAEDNGLMMRGHTLVWHSNMPSWLDKTGYTKDQMLDFLKEYITKVVTRYKGKLYAWDVLNEIFSDNGELRNKDSVWYRFCGEDYIEKSFIWAHEADPDAKLYLNDYNVETINAKSTAMYKLVQKLIQKKIPINGVGFQCHFNEESPPNFASVYANVKRFADLGMEVQFTEIDVKIKNPANPAKLQHQAEIYGELMNIALNFENVTNFTTWGVSDAYSWIPEFSPGYGSALIFDKHFNPKPAYYAIQVALQSGPVEPDYDIDNIGRHVPLPFVATQAETAPVVDGNAAKGEWDAAILYPFAYNQLSRTDQRLPDPADIDCTWRVTYKDNNLYGIVTRKDDKTVTNDKKAENNDGMEICFGVDKEFTRLVSVVGRDFEKSGFKGKSKAVWSKDGTYAEFSIALPYDYIDGSIIGWNIAITDNDGNNAPESRIFPVTGENKSASGLGFAELAFQAPETKSKRIGSTHVAPPFKAAFAGKAPVIDGAITGDEWSGGVSYQLSFNQLSLVDLTYPPRSNLYGDWRVLYNGKTLYCMVQRTDDDTYVKNADTWKNDTVEVFFDLDGVFLQLRTLVGADFEKSTYTGKRKAVWSADGKVLEFSIDMPVADLKGLLSGWNIALADNDKGTSERDRQLYALNGTNVSWQNLELGEIVFE